MATETNEALASSIKEVLRVRGIDVEKTRFSVTNGRVFLSLPGDDGFDIFHGYTTHGLLLQVIERCNQYRSGF